MPLSGHLGEARRRGITIAVTLAVAAVAAFLGSDRVLDLLRDPLLAASGTSTAAINYDSVTGAFDLKLKIALYGGIALSSPVWIWQLLGFVVPALTGRERRHVLGFTAALVVLFAAGCAVGAMLLPRVVELLAGFASAEDATLLEASAYVDFVLTLVLASGVAFTLPAFLVILNATGVLPARSMARGWRVWLVAIVVLSALVTPAADLLSMFLVAAPLGALFGAALLVAWMHDRAAARRDDARRAVARPDGASLVRAEGAR